MMTPSIYGWEIGKASFCFWFFFYYKVNVDLFSKTWHYNISLLVASRNVGCFPGAIFSRTSTAWKFCLFLMRDIFCLSQSLHWCT